MTDPARKYANLKLEEIERRVIEVYGQALRESEQKFLDYMKEVDRQAKAYQTMVKNGQRTQAQYERWAQDQILGSRQMQENMRELELVLRNSAEVAQDIINGELPDVYAISHDWGTYEVESGTGINTQYNLYDRDTVVRLIAEQPDLYPQPKVKEGKLDSWNSQKLTSAITQAVIQGELIDRTAKRIERLFGSNAASSMRMARTCMTGAENSGRVRSYERAETMGIKVRKKWLATLDDRTRASHRQLDGESVDVEARFSNGLVYPGDPNGRGEEVYNCFLGDTLFDSDSEIVRSYRHLYRGKTVTVNTAGGVHFTCTPNHPILSTRGWVAADGLHEGDDLLVTCRSWYPATNPDVDHAFSSFETFHDLTAVFGYERASRLSVDFHGDRPTSNVEVVSEERFLRVCLDALGFKGLDELSLVLSDPSAAGLRLLGSLFDGRSLGTSRYMGLLRKTLSLVNGSGTHADVHGLRAVAGGDTVIAQDAIYNLPAETMIRSELLDGLSGKVTTDKIVRVEVGSTRGAHVYNLQTGNGYYFVNSIIGQMDNGIFAIAKNCRCTLVADLTDFPAEQVERASRLHGMSYEEWREEHER